MKNKLKNLMYSLPVFLASVISCNDRNLENVVMEDIDPIAKIEFDSLSNLESYFGGISYFNGESYRIINNNLKDFGVTSYRGWPLLFDLKNYEAGRFRESYLDKLRESINSIEEIYPGPIVDSAKAKVSIYLGDLDTLEAYSGIFEHVLSKRGAKEDASPNDFKRYGLAILNFSSEQEWRVERMSGILAHEVIGHGIGVIYVHPSRTLEDHEILRQDKRFFGIWENAKDNEIWKLHYAGKNWREYEAEGQRMWGYSSEFFNNKDSLFFDYQDSLNHNFGYVKDDSNGSFGRTIGAQENYGEAIMCEFKQP